MPRDVVTAGEKRRRKVIPVKENAGSGTAGTETGGLEASAQAGALELFHPVTAKWFRAVFEGVTAPQREGWPAIARGESTLILAPTGTGKTLTAFLWCLDRLMLQRPVETGAVEGCRVVYLSPLKALAVDVERNLRSPLAGMANMAQRDGVPVHVPTISVRTGDTPQKERAQFKRHPGEILITTPESLYLLLTSSAGDALRSVETVIIDEIHALVPSKRGAHMMLSLERLEALVAANGGGPIQRIGLSATQRPLEEVARFLGGAAGEKQGVGSREQGVEKTTADEGDPGVRYRPVTIVNAGARKVLELKVEVPVEDMAKLGEIDDLPSGAASQGPKRTSIWQSIHPRLLEIVRERTSTLIFVNARRVAERLAGAINELAGESIARAHHGSLAAAQRSEIEELLKAGKLRALVCTSSLELGIDMGAVDLVIQIEAPPSVASGMQRIGRAGHQVGAPSAGIIFPKYRADLIACAAVTQAMHEGHVESTRFLRNPLDVLAQQIVAVVAHPPVPVVEVEKVRKGKKMSPGQRGVATAPLDEEFEEEAVGISYDALFALVRSAAPFAGMSATTFNGVLDMLAGRYPSDEFAELRPRVTWDREKNLITPRQGVKRIAILNGGTIPDRGTYGVFLSGATKPLRVGELDEEMVFEARTGETFVLGASTWRIDEITQDRVLVSPAPGEPGKMPFWHGDRPGRPIEFGRRIGALVRELRAMPRSVAMTKLVADHDLDERAAENVLRYLVDQELATEQVPDDRTIVIERVRDELGDWRVCVLTPLGSRVHAPWAMAVSAKIKAAGLDVETMWSEDGFVLRFPESDAPPEIEVLLMAPLEAQELVLQQLGSTALFAAKFREAASRALLLPRRRAEGRTPLWQQRKRAYDLLSVASRYSEFPMLLEAYRECLRDVFDMPALMEVLRGIETRTTRVHVVDSRTPSPFAGALLFSYVANYIYDGDAPLAERRAQALAIDQDQLRELLGDADLRELLDAAAIEETEEQLQCVVEGYRARNMDGVHDLLLRLGDMTRAEIALRCESAEVAASVDRTDQGAAGAGAVSRGRAAGDRGGGCGAGARCAGRAAASGTACGVSGGGAGCAVGYRAEVCKDAWAVYDGGRGDAVCAGEGQCGGNAAAAGGAGARGGRRLPAGRAEPRVDRCNEVLRSVRRKSLAKLRKEVEPVAQRTLARLFTRWQGVVQPRRGLDALLDAIENLQGAPLPASLLETEILPARILGYKSADLDTLIAAGEVVWVGLDPIGERDGRVGLYLAEKLSTLWPVQSAKAEPLSEKEQEIVEWLKARGASFFQELHDGLGGGYPGETLEALWALVWRGLLMNDGMLSLRAYCERPAGGKVKPARRVHNQAGFRSRRTTPPTAQGRWSLNAVAFEEGRDGTRWSHAIAQQLLTRYGVVFRETAHAEGLQGGFSAVYDVMKALEESGKVRRGYFAADLGATQFAMPAAVDLLRSLRVGASDDSREVAMLAATDPANPYGALLRWPAAPEEGSSLTRSVGARVVLVDGALTAYLRRGNPNIQVMLPEEEPGCSQNARALAEFLVAQVQRAEKPEGRGRSSMVITQVNGVAVAGHPLARFLLESGFVAGAMGFNVRKVLPGLPGRTTDTMTG